MKGCDTITTMIYEERIKLRDELYKEFRSIGIIGSKDNRFIKVNIKRLNDVLKDKWNRYTLEFRSIDEAIYCITHNDDYTNHICPICNKYSTFQDVKPKRYKVTCGDMKCISKILHSDSSNTKRKKVMIERYGTECPLSIKEVQDKVKKTNIEKYGVDNVAKSKDIQDKIKKTNKANFGVEYPMQCKEIHDKAKATNLERYGYICSSKNDEVKEKARQTNIVRYGVDWTSQNKDIKDKQIKTNLERYGFENPMSSKEVQERQKKTYQERYGCIDPILEKEVLELFDNQYTLSDIYSKDNLFKELILKKYKEKNRLLRLSEIANIFDKKSQTIKSKILKLNLCNYFYIIDSKLELKFKRLLESIGLVDNKDFVRHNRNILPITELSGHQELDFYIEDRKIAFEINDIEGHNSSRRDKDYHLNKTLNCIIKGIRLVHIWECEMTNEEYWDRLSRWIVELLLDESDKVNIDSNDCIVKLVSIDEEEDFLNKYSIEGYIESSICIGLYHNNELIQLISFSKSYNDNNQYKIIRMSTRYSISIIDNGYKKILGYFINTYNPNSIIGYCNLDKYSDIIYKDLGFKFIERIDPIEYSCMYNCGIDIYILDILKNKG